jgi:uncharacterized membrane protein YhdT
MSRRFMLSVYRLAGLPKKVARKERKERKGPAMDRSIMLRMADSGNKKRSAHWNWLLILPALGLLFPAVYARETPALFGFPFFYWYQFAWVFLTAAITGLVYLLVKQ